MLTPAPFLPSPASLADDTDAQVAMLNAAFASRDDTTIDRALRILDAARRIEVAPMLVLSTAHLFETTCTDFLSRCPGAYRKGDAGWFVHVETVQNLVAHAPIDLRVCAGFANTAGSLWIMFDRDGPVLGEDILPSYDW